MRGVETATRDGLVFDLTAAGPPDGEPVVLLHGFPQSARSWELLTPLLTAAGLRTVAADQRGYSPGARPVGRAAYRFSELVADAATIVEAALAGSGHRAAHVVGHDWGAAVAWGLAGHRPDLVRTVTGVSVPPPGAFRAALRRPRQVLASWYVGAFQVPGLAERVFATPPGRQWSPALVRVLVGSGQSRDRAKRDAAGMAEPSALTAALNWYRALPLEWRYRRDEAGPAGRGRPPACSARPAHPVTVPALYVWSDRDPALTRDAAERAPEHVAGPLRYVELRGVSHWIPEEAPDALAALLLDHIAARPVQ
jgi:pimeloyl-ACP methyl ester carboxylesterase